MDEFMLYLAKFTIVWLWASFFIGMYMSKDRSWKGRVSQGVNVTAVSFVCSLVLLLTVVSIKILWL